jgi:hypothetical protein
MEMKMKMKMKERHEKKREGGNKGVKHKMRRVGFPQGRFLTILIPAAPCAATYFWPALPQSNREGLSCSQSGLVNHGG